MTAAEKRQAKRGRVALLAERGVDVVGRSPSRGPRLGSAEELAQDRQQGRGLVEDAVVLARE
jgi:hypothetical protein